MSIFLCESHNTRYKIITSEEENYTREPLVMSITQPPVVHQLLEIDGKVGN